MELGSKVYVANLLGHDARLLDMWAGDFDAAVERGEESERLYAELGERSFASTAVAYLAHSYYEVGRLDDAERAATRAAELGASDDLVTQMLLRSARAKVLARRGEHEEAERHAREALAIAESTDMLNSQADTYADLAVVLELAGKDPRFALEEALARYERKENLVMAERTRERLESLAEEAPA